MFNVGDKVIIESNDYLIGGIHNHDTLNNIINKFDEFMRYRFFSECWSNKLKGTIACIGNFESYVIESEGKYYNFSNDFNEMKLDKMVDEDV